MNRFPPLSPYSLSSCSCLFAVCGGGVAAQPADDITRSRRRCRRSTRARPPGCQRSGAAHRSDATAFELTVVQPIPKGITVSYPENTGGFSSLYKQSTLLAGDTDYSSIKVQVADTVHGNQQIS